jgi:serine/threonine protein kinase
MDKTSRAMAILDPDYTNITPFPTEDSLLFRGCRITDQLPVMIKVTDAPDSILLSLAHPNVVFPLDHFSLDSLCFLVLPLAPHGTLASFSHKRRLPPYLIHSIVTQMVTAVYAAHKLEIAHGNITLDHFLVFGTPDSLHICLSSFTHAHSAGKPFNSPPNSEYSPPEQLLKRHCSIESDIWSLGVAIYRLIIGHPPFTSAISPRLNHRHLILTGRARIARPQFTGDIWSELGRLAELISKMIVEWPDERITAIAILGQDWQ